MTSKKYTTQPRKADFWDDDSDQMPKSDYSIDQKKQEYKIWKKRLQAVIPVGKPKIKSNMPIVNPDAKYKKKLLSKKVKYYDA